MPLTDVDRIQVRQVRDGHDIIEFSAQYETLINGHWRKITRYDNAHGLPHRHVYYPNTTEYRQLLATGSDNQAFTEAIMILKKKFPRMKEQYILLMNRSGGGK